MKRNIDLNEISDGRLYSSGDMVKADCHDCAGCSACCRGMGDSIKLDPMDIWRLKKGVGKEDGKKIVGWRCKICNYVYEGSKLPEDYACPLCGHGADDFEPIYES